MPKIFSAASEEEVIERASCTWCGVRAGEPCLPPSSQRRAKSHDLPGGYGTAHAQRWYDLWNETHGPREQIEVHERGSQR